MLRQAWLVKNQSGLQACENCQFNKTKQTARPSNRNKGQKL